mmetsp:Transcript_12114/g.48611  ORF Transcript_12114/g.48611 Transcript_12114/m.48611 type:complete len:384 (-) Transcript_12114:284-1435(-)
MGGRSRHRCRLLHHADNLHRRVILAVRAPVPAHGPARQRAAAPPAVAQRRDAGFVAVLVLAAVDGRAAAHVSHGRHAPQATHRLAHRVRALDPRHLHLSPARAPRSGRNHRRELPRRRRRLQRSLSRRRGYALAHVHEVTRHLGRSAPVQPRVRHQDVAPRVPLHPADGFPVVGGWTLLVRRDPADVTDAAVADFRRRYPRRSLLRGPHVVRAEPPRLPRAVTERRLGDNLRVSMHPTPSPAPRGEERAAGPDSNLRVARRGSGGDARGEGREPAHRSRLCAALGDERLRQEHQSAALAVDDAAARRERGDGHSKASVAGELLRVQLGVPAAEQYPPAPLRQRVPRDGRERHQIRAALAKQRQILAVVVAKRGVAGDAHANRV